MRIISGTLKGRILSPGKNFTARPTTDFAREGLFNILSNQIDFEQTQALDLFAGAGSISFELISRGCLSVDALEILAPHAAFIKKTADSLNLKNLHVIQQDVQIFTSRCKKKYDLVFADPPYSLAWISQIPEMIISHEMLAENGLFVLEHPKTCDFSSHPWCVDHRKYGNVHFSFFRKP